MRVRTRLLVSFILIVSLGFFGLVQWLIGDLRPRYLESMEESLLDTSYLLAAFLSQRPETLADTSELQRAFSALEKMRISARIHDLIKTQVELRVYITDAKGKVLFDSQGTETGKDFSRWNNVLKTLGGEYGARSTRLDPSDPSTSIMHVSAPITVAGQLRGVVTVAKPTRSVGFFIHSARRKILLAGAAIAAGVLLLGWATTAWVTRPIERLTQYARDVRDGRRGSIPRFGSSEIKDLGAAFEEMREALEGKKYVESYVQTLTHEIKSPLTAIRGAAEILSERTEDPRSAAFVSNLVTESGRIAHLIDRMLVLASLESRRTLEERAKIDVGKLLLEIRESLAGALAARQLQLRMEVSENVTMLGDPFLIRHAVTNLIQNAIEFSPEAGEITLHLHREADKCVIEIADQGPGIPEFAKTRVFEKFYSLARPGTGRKSSGLGLNFVREVTMLHGGSVALDNRAGRGAVASITLPLQPV